MYAFSFAIACILSLSGPVAAIEGTSARSGSMQADASELLMERAPENSEEAAKQALRIVTAMEQDHERAVQNLFMAWVKAHDLHYPSAYESNLAMRKFSAALERLLGRDAPDFVDLWRLPEQFIDVPLQQTSGGHARAAKAPPAWLRSARDMEARELSPTNLVTQASVFFATAGGKAAVAAAPIKYNHQTLSNLGPVMNQGISCASCWACSTGGAIEAAMIIRSKLNAGGTALNFTALPVARQAIVDCANPQWTGSSTFANDKGCYQGVSLDAMIFAATYYIPIAAFYPYTSSITGSSSIFPLFTLGSGTKSGCRLSSSAKTYTNATGPYPLSPQQYVQTTGAIQWSSISGSTPVAVTQKQMMYAVSQQPVVFFFNAATSWYAYAAGTTYSVSDQNDYSNGCFYDYGDCDHAMLAVGYDSTLSTGNDNGPGQWTIMNTWGTTWGNKGFAQVEFSNGVNGSPDPGPCGMFWFVTSPNTTFINLPTLSLVTAGK